MNNFKALFMLFFWLLLVVTACNRDDISFENPSKLLRFSADTVFLDTVYNQVRSETYAVKIYNDEDKDLSIPQISLASGAASLYRINVDGRTGTEFANIPLRKKDSLYIFVEIAPVANTTEAIAEERINIKTPAGLQHITLFSVVQDAEFFIQTESNANILTTDVTWNSDKAKIIFGDLTIAEDKTLNIAQGTKVYFHRNSRLTLAKNATLNVNGDLQKEVVFRGDRNDPRYDTIPKNWQGIVAEPGAKMNLNYARIFGGTRGLELKEAQANIRNTIIHTHQEYGILAINANLTATNLVINNCGEAALGIFKGGTYSLTHSTIANYWDFNSALPGLGLYASNEYQNKTGLEQGPLNLQLHNTIVYTDKENGTIFKPTAGQAFNYLIQNSLLKYGGDAGFAFDGNSNIVNSIKNQDPKFQHYFTQKLNLRLKDDSPAKGKGNLQTAQTAPLDLVKVSRLTAPTIGAYQ